MKALNNPRRYIALLQCLHVRIVLPGNTLPQDITTPDPYCGNANGACPYPSLVSIAFIVFEKMTCHITLTTYFYPLPVCSIIVCMEFDI